ncbi:MAG: aminopeptidase, partial [Actinomycetes bacterium]
VLTLATTTATPVGTYAVTVKATGASSAATTTVTLSVAAAPTTTTTTSSTTTTTVPACASAGQKVLNPGFESGTTSWTATANTIGKWTAQPPRTGLYNMWLGGLGKKVTEYGQQSVVIPAGCTTYTLSFWLHIDTAETTTATAYDKLTVTLGSTTLATYSNLNKVTGYVQKTFNVSTAKGTTSVLKFNAAEDASNQTSFVIDDVALTVG